MKETLGEYIHQLRLENEMTLTKLAAALDIDQSTLSKIENNKRSVNLNIIAKVAETFQLDFKTLEMEYNSQRIAEIIYLEKDTQQLFQLAQEKAQYLKVRNTRQGNLKFEK